MIQTDLSMADIDMFEKKLESREEDIISWVTQSDERANFYTGLGTIDALNTVYGAIESGTDRMRFWYNSGSANATTDKVRKKQSKIPPYFQFVMCLMRLRLDLPLLLLADLFNTSTTSVTRMTISWVSYMHQVLVPALLVWAPQSTVRSWMPKDFQRHYPNTQAIIDCSEFFIDTPSNKEEQYKTYSQYKSHNTYKCLLSITPYGAFNIVSDLWSGNVSDKFLTENSGFLDNIVPGDEVMADRGFMIEDLLLPLGSKLVAPPFTRKYKNSKGRRLNVQEIRITRMIARLRIHIERAIQRVKCLRIVGHKIPASLKDISSMIVKVISALCNTKLPLFYDKKPKKRNKRKPLKRLQQGRKAKSPVGLLEM